MNSNKWTGRVVLAAVVMLLLSGAFGYAFAEDEDENGNESGAVAESEANDYTVPPKVTAKSAILIDVKTGDVLYEKKADVERAPASCTKIMTALLAIENLGLDDILTVTEESCNIEGSSVGLVPGEEIRAEDMFYAALLESGNDAATALAVGVDGSVEEFAARMNERARQLGLTHTHFVNPHGLNDPEHYTSARDLAFIAREAMKNDNFRTYVTTYEHTMPPTNIQPERLLHNSNRMLYDENRKVTVYGEKVSVKYPDGLGIKTGYTSDAGSCLVSGVSRNGLELISVILKSEGMDMYADTMSLLEYGLHNFEEVTYMKKGDVMFERPLANSDQKSMNFVLAEDLTVTVNKNESSSYAVDGEITQVATEGGLTAPIKAGDVFGQAWVKDADGRMIATADLVAQSSVEPKKEVATPWDEGVGALSLVFRIIGIACLVAVVIVVIAIIRATVKRRRRRRNRMYGAKLNSSVDTQEVRRIKTLNKANGRRR
jgi:D-alanyl-D-alanine carboxypeptidase (penicillin-binding protein 5/6)